MFPVSPLKQRALLERMEALGVKEADLEESFVRSRGKGGQHVNKTSTCVQLRHIPTSIEVKCQNSRSQSLNRYYARVMLLDKIEYLLKGKDSTKAKEIERIRKQKLRRKKRSALKGLVLPPL
jgi:protein subunit release factor B